MKEFKKRDLWTATQVLALTATGLAASHTQPFVRLLYNDPKTRVNKDIKSRTIVVDGRDSDDDIICCRQQEQSGKFTASWNTSNDTGEVFTVHPVVDWVEMQLWNHFDNGFDVFLGKASISLHQLQQQCSQEGKDQNSLRTGALWFPLQSSKLNGVALRMSLEIECVFMVDPKVLRIRKAMEQRQHKADVKDTGTSVADPTFTFIQPYQPVEWSLIASTNVRHLFFHSDVERLANFREIVLYGDLEKELDDDEGLQIDVDHLTAYKMCQFSAQYLDHCIDTLSQRIEGYRDDYRALADTKAQLSRENKALTFQRKCLQKEHDELDLFISTYQRLLEKNSDGKLVNERLEELSSSDRDTYTTKPLSPSMSLTEQFSFIEPTVHKTWKECERDHQSENDLFKTQQMEIETQRLAQRVLEQQQREYRDKILSIADENRKLFAVKKIQVFFRNIQKIKQTQQETTKCQAAIRIQAAWKRFMEVKKHLNRLETQKREISILLMAQSERETRQWEAEMKQNKASTNVVPLESTDEENIADIIVTPSASPSKHVVDALVTTWRKLHRVFVLAHKSKGIAYHALFDEIDLRKDKVIDRAELRLGAWSFGIRLDRKITRALITLLRTKCQLPSKPLLVTYEQFMTGFELTSQVMKSSSELENSISHSEKRKRSTDENENLESAKTDEPLVKHTSDAHEKEPTDEEKLVMAVHSFRAAVYKSAATNLGSTSKFPIDSAVLRDTLTHICYPCNTDCNSRLEVNELISRLTKLNLQLTNDQISILRKLFLKSNESDEVDVAEFLSFVLTHSSSTDKAELGLLGHSVRELILKHVRKAPVEIGNIEDAVRFVFREAYKHSDQPSCSIRDFMHALKRLHLEIAPIHIARFVVTLDRDGDGFIYFDELLTWLRLHSFDLSDKNLQSASEQTVTSQQAEVEALQDLFEKLAFAHTSNLPFISHTNCLTTLFHHIDRDKSGKINQEELHAFLSTQDLLSFIKEDILKQVCELPTLPEDPSAVVAQKLIKLLDSSSNGVVTLKEWLKFGQHDIPHDSSDLANIDAMRKILCEAVENDVERLLDWFHDLPGIIQAPIGRHDDPNQMQVRVAEFKTALRVKVGGTHSVPRQTIDEIVNKIDKNKSGWITTSELCAWTFPSRDLDELLRLIIKCWQKEYQQTSTIDLANNLYARFDVDHNGCLGVRELRQGFKTFGLNLSEYETRVLLIAFDLDSDGCWNKAEFSAFVSKLTPVPLLISDLSTISGQNPINNAEHQAIFENSHHSHESFYSDDSFSDSKILSESSSRDQMADSVHREEYSEDFIED
ncbi:putative calcium binding protein [Plasmopara halstedii]